MLIGGAICLAPLMREDAVLLFKWRNEPAVARANGPFRPIDQLSFDAWFNAGVDPSRVVFAVRAKEDFRLLGFVQLVNIQSNARSADLGILIGPLADRNRGYGHEAVAMAVAYGWWELNLQRVALSVVGENPAAVRTYGKAGFEIEGVLRRAAFVEGAYRDITIMACLREP